MVILDDSDFESPGRNTSVAAKLWDNVLSEYSGVDIRVKDV